jgi:PAS domain S-box-containing protein
MREKPSVPARALNLRKRAEEKARTDDVKTKESLSPEDARQLLHELRVHQIELEMQNEELRRTQEALEASRARYFDLFDLAPVGYFTLSEPGLILEANLTAATLWGVERDALVKKPLSRLILPEDQDIYYRYRKQVFETGAPQGFEMRMLRADAAPFWAHLETTVVKDDASGATVCRAVVSDISNRKQAEVALRESGEALRRLNEQLEQKIQERTVFLTDTVETLKKEVEHRQKTEWELACANEQLNARANQLRALAGELTMAEHRERKRLSTVLHDHLQQMLVSAKLSVSCLEKMDYDAIRKAAAQIEEVLGESLKISRSLAFELSPPILHEGSLQAGLEWLDRWIMNKHGLKVDLVMQKDIPSPAEDVKILLFESVRELLFNIVKHANVSCARVSLQQQMDGAGLQIMVSDEGAGFDPGQLKPAGENGGGFGLFSIRERIGLIGGRFDIDSVPGKGSRFTLTVAYPQESTASLSANPMCTLVGKFEEGTVKVRGSTIRVLLADDHALVRDGIDRLLKKEPDISVVGYAKDGQEAIELARKLKPDVILMDISMPVINGIEATRVIHQEYPNIWIIGLSVYEDQVRAQVMREAGAIGYINKGCAVAELLAAVRACLKGRDLPHI